MKKRERKDLKTSQETPGQGIKATLPDNMSNHNNFNKNRHSITLPINFLIN